MEEIHPPEFRSEVSLRTKELVEIIDIGILSNSYLRCFDGRPTVAECHVSKHCVARVPCRQTLSGFGFGFGFDSGFGFGWQDQF